MPNSTDKLRRVLVSIKRFKKYYSIWDRKPNENRKNRRREDTHPDDESGQTNARITVIAVDNNKPSCMQISLDYGGNKNSEQLFILVYFRIRKR